MKKIFTLFAALVCVMSMSAKVIYLKPNSNWQQAHATFWVHAWGAGDKDVKMTPVEGDPTVYQAEVGESTSIIFMRRDPNKDASNVWDLWNRMGNLAIPADKNCCAIKEGEWTQEKDDASEHVTWSVYTPSTGGEDPDPGTGGDDPKPEQTKYYITGTLAGGWDVAQLQLTENNGVWSHTFTDLPADSTYKFKITNGTWDENWGADAVKDNPNVYKDADGNAVFDLVAGDVTVSFDGSNITVIGNLAEVELPVLVYNVTVPAGTKACYIAGAMNGWSQEEMTKVDDTHYTISIKGATTEMKYKYCSGPSWDYEEVTADGGKVEDRVYSENDVVAAWKAVYAPGEEPGEEPGEDPEPEYGVTYNVTVPAGTYACYIAGEMNGWSHTEMTKVDDTHYTITIDEATKAMKYKYCSGPSWDYVEMQADGVNDVQDRTYSENDVVEAWKAVYNPAGTDPGTDPTEIKYVLMGVGGDWANGIDMTANPDNADEYMLLGQTISEGDSVKVVRLEDGVAKHWCGNVKDGCKELVLENTVNDNIVLAPGVYDFYYDVVADQIWIATSVHSAIDNVVVENKAVKVIRNGQMYILRDGVMYNALGQMAE